MKNKILRVSQKKPINIIVSILFGLLAISIIYPLIWLVMSSLKDNWEFFTVGNTLKLPKEWHFENYIEAIKSLNVDGTSFFGMIFNSIWFTVSGTFLTIFFCFLTAYALSKCNLVGKKVIYAIIIFQMIIPVAGTLGAAYKLMKTLGLYDSPLYMLNYIGGGGFNFFVFYGILKNLSNAYTESATIDGAGAYRRLFSIILPMMSNVFFALCILSGVGLWNTYMVPLIWLPSYPTLQSGLYVYSMKMIQGANYPVYFAGIVICSLPILVCFGLFQNTLMSNVSFGGLKG